MTMYEDGNLTETRKYAAEFGWMEIDHQENIYMVSFMKGDSRINVYYSRMTVATIVNHPKWGRNQMFRKNVWSKNLREIFKDPRAHLIYKGVPGYHEKGKHMESLSKEKKKK